MPLHSVVQRSRIAFSMKIVLETAPVKAANSASTLRSANAQPSHTFHGTGGQSGTRLCQYGCTCPAATYLWRWQTPSPPGCSDNSRGRKRECHAHIHHHWPPREVHKEVTALRIALGARRELCRIGGAAGVCGSSSTGGSGGIGWGGGGYGRALRWPGAAVALASAGAAVAEAVPGAAAAECPRRWVAHDSGVTMPPQTECSPSTMFTLLAMPLLTNAR